MGESEELYFLTRRVVSEKHEAVEDVVSAFAMIVPEGREIRSAEVLLSYPRGDSAAGNRTEVTAFLAVIKKLGVEFKEGDLIKKILGGDYEVFSINADAAQLCAHSSGDLARAVLSGPNTRPFVIHMRNEMKEGAISTK